MDTSHILSLEDMLLRKDFYLNSLRAKFFRGNINMYSYFMSFLHTDTPKVIEILPRTYLFYIVNIMVADVLATQEARASATMILT